METHHYTCDICGKQSDAMRDRYSFGDTLPDEWRAFTVRHKNHDKDGALLGGSYRSADCCSQVCLRKAIQKYLDKTA